MPYPYDQIIAADPSNPERVAANGVVTIFAPGDTTQTPLTITTLQGLPLTNPIKVNEQGYGPAFMHDTLDQVAWSGAGFTGLFVSYKGLKEEAVAARQAAGDIQAKALAGEFNGEQGGPGPRGLPGVNAVPADTAVAAYAGAAGTETRKTLDQMFIGRSLSGDLTGSGSDYIRIIDAGNAAASIFRLEDASGNKGSILNLHHRGAGEGGAQAYGVNIANHVGARNAVTVHQYSKAAPAFQIDNTDVASGIYIKNTENQTQNPGGTGTGNFLQFKPFSSTDALFLTDGLQWLNRTDGKDMSVASLAPVNYTFAVLATAADKQGMYVSKSGTGAGAALGVNNLGTGNAISVLQNGLAEALKITTTAAANGVYAARINGQGHGLILDTINNGGNTLDIDKKGTGNGIAFKLRNLGTGDTISILNSTGVVARVSAAGEYENLTPGTGVILRSPAGARYRISVDNAGTVKATAI